MAAGIIAEYNPFHAGHSYQISEARKLFPREEIVAVMSGSFSQRGEPTILDKWTRATLAVENGIDLVLELPFVSAVRSAQDFASGGVKILSELGIIDKLVFGAETSDLKKIQAAAKCFGEKNFPNRIKFEMSSGISYAAAVTKSLSAETNLPENFFKQPNTILAVEYLRALPENIFPVLIPRVGAGYKEKNLQENFSSASAIRAEVFKKNPAWEKILQVTNKKIFDALQAEKKFGLVRGENLFLPLLTKIFTTSPDEIKNFFGMREGLENLILKSAKNAKNFSDLVNKITNRRYQTSRVKRLLLYFLLGVTEIESADFIRVLAFNDRGQKLLKKISQVSNLPIVTKVTKHLTEKDFLQKNFSAPYKKNLALDISATNLRNILFDTPKSFGQDFLTSPKKIFSLNSADDC